MTRLRTILDLFDRHYDFKPFEPRGHKVFNGMRTKIVRGFRYENHA